MRTSALVAVLVAAAAIARAEPLVGPGVGNADLLVAEGNRLYNEKEYAKARDRFLKATRVAPGTTATYLSLARSLFALKDLERACAAYRVFVKSAPASPDRDKAQGELDLCDRQLAATAPGGGLVRDFVARKAAFFEALERDGMLGPGSAADVLAALIGAGYAAPDLGDMAAKLAARAEAKAAEVHRRALAHEQVAQGELRHAAQLYRLSLDLGTPAAGQPGRAAYLDGLALLQERQAAQAEVQFEEASRLDPADTESRFLRALARYSAGDKAGALRMLDASLPGDPRAAVLRAATALDQGGAAGASELERLLFTRRFKSAP